MKPVKIYRLFFRLAQNKFSQSNNSHNFLQNKTTKLHIWNVNHEIESFYTFSYYPTFWESIPFTVRRIMIDTPTGYDNLQHIINSLRVLNDEDLKFKITKTLVD